ncbi:MAG: M1 family metallopeptidase [Acidobacteria bacterium]|nr:M1 family metallopeptidase [Acidobacteriota bacterium]
MTGKQVLTWKNITKTPTNEIWFHLYFNAWKNRQSTWFQEDALRAGRKIEDGWGHCTVESIRILPFGRFSAAAVTGQLRRAAPDDGNPHDETVAVLSLPRPVRPGESIQLEIHWRSKIPRPFSVTGYRGDFFFLAQWFPKVGVYQADGTWNCHQFHANTEFFSDFGIYDVRITVPQGWLVGATGMALKVTRNADATATHHFYQQDVHDFAWTTSPEFREARRRFEHPGVRPVEIRFLYLPDHEYQVDRHLDAAAGALRYFQEWFGEYPYGHLTLIDPAYGGGFAGMEYPTLVTCGTRYFSPPRGQRPERVTIHEIGHQWWYGMVANNEFEDAWMDEGLTTYTSDHVLQIVFGRSFEHRFFRGFIPVIIPDITIDRLAEWEMLDSFRRAPRADLPAAPSFSYFPGTAGTTTYFKSTLWLHSLERTLGEEKLRGILRGYFDRWKFRHPRPKDFLSYLNEHSGQDLDSLFDQVYYRSAVFDFSVESVVSERLQPEAIRRLREGGQLAATQHPGSQVFETRIVVRRLQDGVLPVEVLLHFDDGTDILETWDGKSEWKLFRLFGNSKLSYAMVDPQQKITLDINFTNNSKTLAPVPHFPTTKWASKWMIWLQDFIHTLSFLA